MNTFLTCASHSPLLYCYDKEPDDWDALQKAYAERQQAVKKFDPDLVFAFGADHFNGFFLRLMPSFCIGLAAEAVGVEKPDVVRGDADRLLRERRSREKERQERRREKP